MGIIEALACGLPCIVTYGTTLGNFVNDNKCGIGVEFNEDEVFEAVKSVYDNLEMRNDFSENSINVVNKNFDWDCIIEKLIKDYKKLKGD